MLFLNFKNNLMFKVKLKLKSWSFIQIWADDWGTNGFLHFIPWIIVKQISVKKYCFENIHCELLISDLQSIKTKDCIERNVGQIY